MRPPYHGGPHQAQSTGISPPNISAEVTSTAPDATSAPSSRTATVTRVPTGGRIRHGLLSRAAPEAGDRTYKGESPPALTSEDEDHRISDSAARPKRFPSASSSRVGSVRSANSRQASSHTLATTPWSVPQDVAASFDTRGCPPDADASDSSSSLGRAKSISSVSSVEAQQAELGPVGPSHVALNVANLPPPSDRHKGVPKANSNAWLYRNAPGMRGARVKQMNHIEAGEYEDEVIESGQATPGKRTRDALRLRIAKSASRLGLKTNMSQAPLPASFGDPAGGDASFAGQLQMAREPSSDEEDVMISPGSRSPMSIRTSFFSSSGPHSPYLLSTPGPLSTFGTTPTEALTRTNAVANAPMTASHFCGDPNRGTATPKGNSSLDEILEGLTRLPALKVSPQADADGQPLADSFAKQSGQRGASPIQRPPLLRADSSNNSQDMPAVPGLALAESAADVSTASTLHPPSSRSVRRDSQLSGASSEDTPQPAARPAPKPSTRCPNDFHFGETLGEGSYSTVLEAWDLLSGPNPKDSGVADPQAVSAAVAMVGAGQKRGLGRIDLSGRKVYAVKVLDKVHILKQGKQKYVTVEKEALSRLIKFPGVITLFWTFQDRDSLYFVLELATNGELLSFIRRYGSFDQHCARFYAAMLAETIRAMHEVGVIHRDVKPENVLLDANMRIKVTDFGSAKLVSRNAADGKVAPPPPATTHARSRAGSFVGTAEYVSPELLAEAAQPASEPSDWWAFGCVLFQMLTGRPPFKGVNEYQTLQKVKHRDFAFPDGFPDDAHDLIDRLLVLKPGDRLTADEVRKHPYFDAISFVDLWEQPVPALKTGMTAPAKQASHESVRSEMSFDEGFVSDQPRGFRRRAQSGALDAAAAATCEDDGQRRRSNDADDSDLSDGNSDADADSSTDAPRAQSATHHRSSGILRIISRFTRDQKRA